MGIKPRTYREGDEVYFGSELKAILEHHRCRGGWIWRRSIDIFRSTTFRRATLIEGIRKCLPASAGLAERAHTDRAMVAAAA